ncbi:HAD family hydrolase, partial [Klebsiella pneumoniae]|uniref:HAD family hydrolase n=1 Tax=Klebsiella pneumoniae TaxID=573 RepID=UPI0025A0E6E0
PIMVGMGRGATQGILIKSAEVLERAHDIKTVVLDKTGTITVGSPRVVAVRAHAPSSEKEVLAIACALEGKSEHPLARAIIEEDRRRG